MAELLVVLGIIGVLAGLSLTLLGTTLRGSATARNSIADVVAELQLARSTAISQGAPTVFVLRPTSTEANAPLEYFAFVDTDSAFSASDAPADPPSGSRLLDRATLATGIVFKHTGSALFSASLAAPLSRVPATSPCTFCDVPDAPRYAAIVFRSGGSAALGSNPASQAFGGSLTLAAFGQRGAGSDGDGDGAAALSTQTIAITSHSGTIFAVSR